MSRPVPDAPWPDPEARPPGRGTAVFAALPVLLLLLGTAAARAAAPGFSLRLEDGPGPSAGEIRLVEACSSFACGRELLAGTPVRSPAWVAQFRDTARIRVPPDTLDPAADWWIVVEAGGLAVAHLWRPGTGGDDLPPAPRLAKRQCRVTVLAANGDRPIAGAIVAPTLSGERTGDAAIRGDPAVFAGTAGWRAWLEPAVTSAAGLAVLDVPGGRETALRIGAPGFVTEAAGCGSAGAAEKASVDAAVVRLERRVGPAEFLLRTADAEALLPGALVRDESGWPVALVDAAGRAALDRTASVWHVEAENGATWIGRPAQGNDAATIDLTPTSMLNQGVVRLADAGRLAAIGAGGERSVREPDSGSTPVDYWIELPGKPWPNLHPAMASLRQTALPGRRFGIRTQPGGRVWFSAAGRGYDACSTADIADGACPSLLPGLAIRGRVLDDRGEALENVEILLARGQVRRGGPVLQQFLRTRRDGRFASDRLPASRRSRHEDEDVTVTIRYPGFLPVEAAQIGRYVTDTEGYIVRLQRGAIVTGAVVDRQSGTPVAGAEVGFGNFSVLGASSTLNSLSALRTGGSYLGRTDADGRFAVRAPPGRSDFAVRSEAHSFRLVRGVEVDRTETQDLGTIFLDPAVLLRGVVLTEAGSPVADARVTAIAQRTPDAFGRLASGDFGDALRMRTGRDGTFVVPGLAPGARVDLEAAAHGFASRRLRGLTAGAADPVEIRLQPGAVIEGRLELHGQPAARTFELFGSSRSPSPDPLSGDPGFVASGRTREDGTFRIAHLASDRYRLLLRTRDGASERVVVELETGEERWLEVNLGGRSGKVLGRVTNRRQGLEGVVVTLHGVGETRTDGRGRFVFENVPAGSCVLEADPGPGELSARRAVRVRRGEQRVNFEFGLYMISGRVLLEDAPAGAAAGELTFLATDARRSRGPIAVDASGRFRAALRRGSYDVGGELAGQPVSAVTPLRVTDDNDDVILRLRLREVSGRISGTVQGLSEAEVVSLRVEAVNEDFAAREAALMSGGNFFIDSVPAGEWTLVGTTGSSGRRAVTRTTVRDGETRADLVFTPGHRLDRVVHLDGTPWSGAQVLLLRDGDLASARRQFTANDGGFAFPDLAAGDWTLAVGAEQRSLRVAGNERADIRLRSGQVVGVVRDAAARPQVGATVLLWPAQARLSEAEALGLVRRSWSDEDGRFEFDRAPSGNWTLQVEGHPRTARTLGLPPGGEVAINVQYVVQ